MNIAPLKREIEQIAKDKGMDRDTIIGALEEAMKQAGKKKYGLEKEIEARFNPDTGEIELFEFQEVVDVITDPDNHISLDNAKRLDPEAEIGDEIGNKLNTEGFGRILAQTAKQVIIQRVRDAERDIVFEEFKDRKGEVVNGIVRRFEKGAIVVDLGKSEAVLPAKEQVPRENYRPGDRIRAYVLDVNNQAKGAQIILSRSSIDFLVKLFAQEVPEIYEGIVYIDSAAREPGGRSKIAVASRDGDVDPVGACVGMKGSRVQAVVQELRGERIDIVPWNPDAARYVCSALSPAAVSKVIIDEVQKSMDVIVPDDQLSLAIGRKGQNVRLAVQLTGWKIDIKSETKMQEMAEWFERAVAVAGLGEGEADALVGDGITSLEDLAATSAEILGTAIGVDEAGASAIKEKAAELAVEKEAADVLAAAEAEAQAKAEAEATAAAYAAEREERAAAAAAAAAAEEAGDAPSDEASETEVDPA